MKRIIKLIIVLVIAFPIFLNATSYGDARDIANNYNSKFPTFKKYLRYEDAGLPYGYSGFKYGGFVSLNEFKITLNGKTNPAYSYLYDGISYWSYPNYAIDDTYETNYAASKSSYNTKVTEFVRSKSTVKGTGTYDNPWLFLNKYYVEVTSSGNGTVVLNSNARRVANDEGREMEEVDEGSTSAFKFNPEIGYVYQGNTCGENVVIENNVLKIKNVNKDIKCSISFKENEYVITLPQPYKYVDTKFYGHTKRNFTDAVPLQLYSQYSIGFFKDSEKKDRLSLLSEAPYRRGWTFKGYFVTDNPSKVTEANRLVDGYTYVRGTSKYNTNFTTDYKLIKDGNWQSKTNDPISFVVEQNRYQITFDADGGTGQNPASASILFENDVPEIRAIPRKAGAIFGGWYTAKNGGKRSDAWKDKYYDPVIVGLDGGVMINGYNRKTTGVTVLDVWLEDIDTTLYANWLTCHVGYYCPGDNTERECPKGYYQDETGQSSCKICPAGTYQDQTGQTSCKQCSAGRYNPNQGSTSSSACKCCSANHYSKAGAASCTGCPSGQESDSCSSGCHTPPPPPSDGGGGGGLFWCSDPSCSTSAPFNGWAPPGAILVGG